MVQGKVSDHFSNIVVGGGLCGAALAYELAKQGQQVLLVDAGTAGATRYSYGGIAYWAGNTPLTQALCRAARSRHPQLSEELGHNTQFRERELLLFVEPGRDGAAIAQTYQDCLEPPQVLTADEAWEREPLLCKAGIGGALAVNHGHVDPIAMTLAYQRAFERLGGERYLGQVTGLGQQGELWVRTGLVDGKTVTGEPVTEETIIRGDRILLSAGAWSRNLLAQAGIHLPLYFSHGEMIELPRAVLEQADLRMQRLVMPAEQVRFGLEAEASQPGFASRWGEAEHPAPAGQELMPPVLDAGVIQFLDGRAAMGQISRLQASLGTTANPSQSEAAMRQKLGKILPAIAALPGQWHSTRIAFSGDGLPLIGPVPGWDNLHLFSGFSSPFVYAIPLAERFAQCLAQWDSPKPTREPGLAKSLATSNLTSDLASDLASLLAADPWLGQMLPSRFETMAALGAAG